MGGSEKFPEMFKLESFVSIFKVEHTGDTTEYEPERDKIKDSATVQDSAPPPERASHFGTQIILSWHLRPNPGGSRETFVPPLTTQKNLN